MSPTTTPLNRLWILRADNSSIYLNMQIFIKMIGQRKNCLYNKKWMFKRAHKALRGYIYFVKVHSEHCSNCNAALYTLGIRLVKCQAFDILQVWNNTVRSSERPTCFNFLLKNLYWEYSDDKYRYYTVVYLLMNAFIYASISAIRYLCNVLRCHYYHAFMFIWELFQTFYYNLD